MPDRPSASPSWARKSKALPSVFVRAIAPSKDWCAHAAQRVFSRGPNAVESIPPRVRQPPCAKCAANAPRVFARMLPFHWECPHGLRGTRGTRPSRRISGFVQSRWNTPLLVYPISFPKFPGTGSANLPLLCTIVVYHKLKLVGRQIFNISWVVRSSLNRRRPRHIEFGIRPGCGGGANRRPLFKFVPYPLPPPARCDSMPRTRPSAAWSSSFLVAPAVLCFSLTTPWVAG